MRKLFEFSVKNPLFVNLLTVFLLVAGVMTLFRMNREVFPNVDFDIVLITTIYPGAAPQEVEKLITIPIEKELKGVSDIKEMSSGSLEGRSVIVLELEPETYDKSATIDDIRRAVDQADLPANLEEDPLVYEIRTRDRPVVEVSVSGEMSEAKLQQHAKAIETRLLDLQGIASIVRNGWREPEIWVEVDPRRAEDLSLSLASIIMSLQKQNINVAGGSLIDGNAQLLIRTTGEFETVEDVKRVVLRANELGHWVQVKDVATVSERFEEEMTILKTDGSRTINLTAVKRQGADAINLVDDIRHIIRDYEATASQELKIKLVNDFSYYVKRRLNVLVNNGWIGMLLVVTMLFLFLSMRAAFMTAIGIPIAFLTTFLLMSWFGMTVNLITMFGLIMVLGMIVDDAIIIAENVYRHIEMGKSPTQAAIDGAVEVWKPVLSAILTTCAAFVPLMYMSGIMGKFVWSIPVVVILALGASLLQAFIVLPSHLAEMERLPHFGKGTHLRERIEANIARWTNRYVRSLNVVLNRRYLFFSGMVLFAALMLFIAIAKIPFVLFPQRGVEAFFVRARAPMGTSVQETARRMEPLERMIAALPKTEVDNFVTKVGVQQEDPNDPSTMRGSHVGQIQVILKPLADREMEVDEFLEQLRAEAKDLEGLEEVKFEKVRPGPPVGRPVEARIKGDDLEELQVISGRVKAYLKTLSGVSEVDDNFEEGKEEIRVVVDPQAAARADLSIEDVALAVRTAMEGTIATTIKKTDEEIDVRVRFPDELRYDPETLRRIEIPNPQGMLVPISAVASFEKAPGLLSINHLDRRRVITVTANVDEVEATSATVVEKLTDFFKTIQKESPGSSLTFGGEWEKTAQSFRDFAYAFAIACMVIFLILACQFQSLFQPIVIMLAIPFGFVGVTLALLMHFEPKSFFVLLGAIGLTGVVVNNSIVFVDFINSLRAEGKELTEAILQAARYRLRPIVLTTVTTVFGVLPVAYGIMGNDPFLKPMALVLGWGLAFSTFSTLFVIPCCYAITTDLQRKWSSLIPQQLRR